MAEPAFQPADEGYAQRVRDSFVKQQAMATIGASLGDIAPGRVVIELPFDAKLTQQHGFMHAGMLGAALDSACGYAAFTLFPAEAGILTVEYKINLLAPGQGERFRLVGQVIKAGRTITLVEGRAWALAGGGEKLIATMTATEMTITGRDGVRH